MNDKVKLWLLKALLRALRTFAQAFVAAVGTAAVLSEVDWLYCLSAAALAALLSLLMSISGIPEVEDGATLGALMKGEPEDGEQE